MTTRKISAPAFAKLQQKLLSDAEVQFLSEQLQNLMGPEIKQLMLTTGLSTDDFFRLGPLTSRLQAARGKKGLSLKEVALALKTTQSRIAQQEKAIARNIDAALLLRYVDFLGLKIWFGRWKKANPELAARIGLTK